MSLTITQTPKYLLVPAYSQIIFAVKDLNSVVNKFNVQYIAKLRLSNDRSNLNQSTEIAKLKTTPNSKGVGIFDFSNIIQSFVESDNLGGVVGINSPVNNSFSQYKTDPFNNNPHSIHIIDKFAANQNSLRVFEIHFKIQFSDTQTGTVVEQTGVKKSAKFFVYNGTLQEEDVLVRDSSGNYGYNLDANKYILNNTDRKFLTNCPTTIEIRNNDYHTLAFFNNLDTINFSVGSVLSNKTIQSIVFTFFDDINGQGTTLGTDTITNTPANGGNNTNSTDTNSRLIFVGAGMANFQNRSLSASLLAAKSYTAKALDDQGITVSQTYTFNVISDDCKGFETIRLTWLNRLGAWDYYTFTKKNIRSIQTNRTSYQQISGFYNEEKFILHGYHGGKKTFNTNSIEKLTLNTDFVNEEEATWLEELFTSPEVYILNSFSDANEVLFGNVKKYVQPVTVTSSTYTRKTSANDKLLQYTVEVERTKQRVIQNA